MSCDCEQYGDEHVLHRRIIPDKDCFSIRKDKRTPVLEREIAMGIEASKKKLPEFLHPHIRYNVIYQPFVIDKDVPDNMGLIEFYIEVVK